MKSGNLNFLEPSGSVQACNGTVLHLLYLKQFAIDIRNSLTSAVSNSVRTINIFVGECCLEGCHRFAPAWKIEGWRKQIRNTMARKWGKAPKKKNMLIEHCISDTHNE